MFVARLVGLPVYGPDGERIGRMRDLVAGLRVDANPPRVLGMVVEMVTRRRIFVPMLRVTTIDPGAVTLATGSVSLRRFLQRPNEVLVVGQLIDAPVRLVDTGLDAVVADAAVEPTRARDWVVSRLAVRERRGRLGRRGQAQIVAWNAVTGPTLTDAAVKLHAAAETGMDTITASRSATKLYRTTPLRGLLKNAPYFHDGSAPTLAAVVTHYDTALSLGLTTEEQADLVEYLKSL